MAQVWNNVVNKASNIASTVATGAKNVASTAWGNYTSWANNVTPGNMANAAVTGVLGIIGTIGTICAGSKINKLYKQQEAQYIDSAMQNARMIQLKGDIELRNLRYKHAEQQGLDELAVAAGANASLSGSFLDRLVANHKYAQADERSVSLSTLWAVTEAKREGYIKAIATAGQAELQAINTRGKLWDSGINGIMRAANSLLQDTTAKKQVEAKREVIDYAIQKKQDLIDYMYYNPLAINNQGSLLSEEIPMAMGDGTFDYSLVKIK